MFDLYADIFRRRGELYHRAMGRYPTARQQEFERIIALAGIARGDVVVDMPSAGGYLADHVASGIRLVAVEPVSHFAEHCRGRGLATIEAPLDRVPVASGTADVVVSLAGLHHIGDKRPVLAEMARLTRMGGICCIADAREGGPVAEFLDVFVGAYNSMGHVGRYIDDALRLDFAQAGFEVIHDDVASYDWRFESPSTMADFCHLLFGLDRAANPEQVLAGIRHHLGLRQDDAGWAMHWELAFLAGRRIG